LPSENSGDVNLSQHIPKLPKNANRSIVHLKSISLTTPSVWHKYNVETDEIVGFCFDCVEGADLAIPDVSILAAR
jgi:hypothetical protein